MQDWSQRDSDFNSRCAVFEIGEMDTTVFDLAPMMDAIAIDQRPISLVGWVGAMTVGAALWAALLSVLL